MADVLRFSKARRPMTMQPKSWAKPLIARASPFMTTGNPSFGAAARGSHARPPPRLRCYASTSLDSTSASSRASSSRTSGNRPVMPATASNSDRDASGKSNAP